MILKNNNIRHKKAIYIILCLATFFLLLTTYITIISNVDKIVIEYKEIIKMSRIGILMIPLIILTHYIKTKKIFSFYMIFLSFFIVFNYGQPILWGLGIFHSNDLLHRTLGVTLGRATYKEIFLTQLITMFGIIFFHIGFLLFKNSKSIKQDIRKDFSFRKNLYKYSLILAIVIFPVTFYNIFYKVYFVITYGYRSYYYSDLTTNIVIFNLLENMFFPIILGLLIGSSYNKKVVKNVYVIFSIYIISSLMAGDRGNWLLKLFVLIFMHQKYYKKINIKKIIFLIPIIFISLQFIDIIVDLRSSVGISFENILNNFTINNNIVTKFIFEMGGSMRPALVLVKAGREVYPYGNSYIDSILGIFSARTLNLLGREYMPLGSWLKMYLQSESGPGFSIIAEAFLNYGYYGIPFVMMIMGAILTSLIDKNNIRLLNQNSKRLFLNAANLSFFYHMIRNPLLHNLKQWFYGVVVFMIGLYIYSSYMKSRRIN